MIHTVMDDSYSRLTDGAACPGKKLLGCEILAIPAAAAGGKGLDVGMAIIGFCQHLGPFF